MKQHKGLAPPSEIAAGALLILATAAVLVAPVPIAALGALVFIVVAYRAPLPSLSLVVLSLPFYLLDRHLGRIEFSPTEILIALNAVAGLLRGVVVLRAGAFGASDKPWFPRPATASPGRMTSARPGGASARTSSLMRQVGDVVGDPAIAGLVLLIVVAGVASLTASVTLRESLRSFRTIVVEPAIFYFLVVTRVRSRRGALVLALALVVAGVLISFVGLGQYLTDQNIITAEEGLRRIRGFYGSPNNLGLFLGRALPMSVALFLWMKRARWLFLIASVVMAIAIFLTFSIGAWVAVGLSLVLVAALRGRATLRLALAAGVVGLVGIGVAALRIPRVGSHFDPRTGTGVLRLEVWESALRMVADHPIRGIGLDNFLYYYQHGYRLPSAWREPDLSHPHNLLLDFWLSLGLPGLLLAALTVGRLVEIVVGVWRTSDALDRGLYAGVAGAVADTILHGFVDNSFFLVDLAVLFWLMFAIVAIVLRAAESQH